MCTNSVPPRRGPAWVVDMTPANGLDAVIALLDEQGTALLVNDHRNVYQGRAIPFIDVVTPHDMAACYVAVSSTPGYYSYGDYRLESFMEHPVAIPAPRPDTVLLVFSGGSNVRIGSRSAVNVPPFDAGTISSVFSGDTDELVELVIENMRRDYEGLDVSILSTSEGAAYEQDMTRLYFGTYDPALLGVADGIDEFNATDAQNAIIFTDTFAAFMQLDPTIDEMAQALANVASHELGHLLGLVHTKDAHGVMDVTASLNQLLIDQTFRRSPLYADVFPIGAQDGLQLLLDSVGGNESIILEKQLQAQVLERGREPATAGPSARKMLYFSTCGLDHAHD